MGGLSTIWYVGLTLLSADVLADSILALGLMIAFYLAIAGFACPVVFRSELFAGARPFLLWGLLPGLGGAILG
jgi:hypothetical protein